MIITTSTTQDPSQRRWYLPDDESDLVDYLEETDCGESLQGSFSQQIGQIAEELRMNAPSGESQVLRLPISSGNDLHVTFEVE